LASRLRGEPLESGFVEQRKIAARQAQPDNAGTAILPIGILSTASWSSTTPIRSTIDLGISRNAILVVDSMRYRRATGLPLGQLLFESGACRFKPILLSAPADMMVAPVIPRIRFFRALPVRCG